MIAFGPTSTRACAATSLGDYGLSRLWQDISCWPTTLARRSARRSGFRSRRRKWRMRKRPTLFLLHCVFAWTQHPCPRATSNRRWSEQLKIAPLVVVIDNAERLGDPKAVAFLMDAAARLSGRLTILFAYGEHPGFTISAQLALIPTWRLPGMTGDEAVRLVREPRSGHGCRSARKGTTRHAQCDGHIGMLLLCRTLVALRNRQQGWANS